MLFDRSLVAVGKAYESYGAACSEHRGKKARKMSSKSTLEMQENVKTERQQLWVQVPQMFQGIAIQLAISFIIVANRAMQRNGMIEDQKTGRESTIDFGELAKLMKMPDVVADLVALQDPKNKVVTAAVQSMQHNMWRWKAGDVVHCDAAINERWRSLPI